MTTLLEGRGLAIGYRMGRGRELRLLDGADFELERGELACLLGPNGSGKSTLLRTVVGMQRPLQGRVELLGRDVRAATPEWRARHVSVVLTEPIDAAGLTSRELVSLGRYPYTDWLGRLGPADHARIDAALAAVDALELGGRRVHSLSDGERQRVLVARALAQQPELMVLDDPTAYLDLPRRIETLGLLRRLVRETSVTVLMSTHHLDLALSHADRVWLLPLGGPLEIGAPEDVALSGALERTFVSERLVYDRAEGTFRLCEEAAAIPVFLEGDGLARRWTERALRREGYVPVDSVGGAVPVARVRILGRRSGQEGASAPRRPRAGLVAGAGGEASDRADGGGDEGDRAAERSRPATARFEVDVAGERAVCAGIHDLLRLLREKAAASPSASAATGPASEAAGRR